jgi:hypothetical protein
MISANNEAPATVSCVTTSELRNFLRDADRRITIMLVTAFICNNLQPIPPPDRVVAS